MFLSDSINVPVLGIIENMAYFTPEELPNNKYYIFGRGGGRELSKKTDVPLLGQIPLVQGICEGSDNGRPVALEDTITGLAFMELATEVIDKVDRRNRELKPTTRVETNNQ